MHTPAPLYLDNHVMWLIDGSLLVVCAQNMVSDGLTMDQTDGTVVRHSVFQDNSDVNLILGGGVDATVQANTVFMRQSQCGAGNTLSHTNTHGRRRTRTHARVCGDSSVHIAAGQSVDSRVRRWCAGIMMDNFGGSTQVCTPAW